MYAYIRIYYEYMCSLSLSAHPFVLSIYLYNYIYRFYWQMPGYLEYKWGHKQKGPLSAWAGPYIQYIYTPLATIPWEGLLCAPWTAKHLRSDSKTPSIQPGSNGGIVPSLVQSNHCWRADSRTSSSHFSGAWGSKGPGPSFGICWVHINI